jgi:hypothetical protein
LWLCGKQIAKFFLDLTMKSFLPVFLIALLPVSGLANPVDTTIRGVSVSFDYSVSIFPESWQTAPVSAAGVAISFSEIRRSKSVLARSLSKYPVTLLKTNLRVVHFLRSMEFFEVGYGGTNSTDALYITNDGDKNGYSDEYLEQTFHHEFSSILYRNYPDLLDTVAWKRANISGFDYNDPEAGVGAIRNNESSQELDTLLCKKGFLTQYAYSDLENDMNTVAQNLFKPDPGFWEIVDKYPRIRQKVKLLIAFYKKLNATFTENYLRGFNN